MGDGVLAFVGAVFGAAVTAALAEILRRQRERARALLVIRSQVRTIHEAVEALGKGDVPRRASGTQTQ